MNIETWIAQRLNTEIATIMVSMRTAADSQREYSIGALSALLWVRCAGELDRATCIIEARNTWDTMRKEVQP